MVTTQWTSYLDISSHAGNFTLCHRLPTVWMIISLIVIIIIIINIKDRSTGSIGFSPVVVKEAAVGDSSQHEGEHTLIELNWFVGLFKWLHLRPSQLCYSNDRCWTTETTACILSACLSPPLIWFESSYSNDSNKGPERLWLMDVIQGESRRDDKLVEMLCSQIWIRRSFALSLHVQKWWNKELFQHFKVLLPEASVTMFRESSNYDWDKK